jgi:hypothetical protein
MLSPARLGLTGGFKVIESSAVEVDYRLHLHLHGLRVFVLLTETTKEWADFSLIPCYRNVGADGISVNLFRGTVTFLAYQSQRACTTHSY